MSERPYKVEQWSKDFAGVTTAILEAGDPKDVVRIRGRAPGE